MFKRGWQRVFGTSEYRTESSEADGLSGQSSQTSVLSVSRRAKSDTSLSLRESNDSGNNRDGALGGLDSGEAPVESSVDKTVGVSEISDTTHAIGGEPAGVDGGSEMMPGKLSQSAADQATTILRTKSLPLLLTKKLSTELSMGLRTIGDTLDESRGETLYDSALGALRWMRAALRRVTPRESLPTANNAGGGAINDSVPTGSVGRRKTFRAGKRDVGNSAKPRGDIDCISEGEEEESLTCGDEATHVPGTSDFEARQSEGHGDEGRRIVSGEGEAITFCATGGGSSGMSM